MENHDPLDGLLREAAWRGELSDEQRRRLEFRKAAHPEERVAWEEEVALTRLLTQLPDAAAPSNLTARVLDALDPQAPRPSHTFGLGWLRKLGWVPRLAGVALLVVVGSFVHHQYQFSKRGELARNVMELSDLATAVPSVEVLQDFNVIRNLETVAVPDEELLALLR
jgi:ferric-dicitrate binding protein FerR (iron transport regulator)